MHRSVTPKELIFETYKFYKANILHDETVNYGNQQRGDRIGYTATGDRPELERFKCEVLKDAHDEFKILVRDLWLQSKIISLRHEAELTPTNITYTLTPNSH